MNKQNLDSSHNSFGNKGPAGMKTNAKSEPSSNADQPLEKSTEMITLSKKEYEDLLSRLQELESLRDKMLRTAADFENAKKRLSRERDDFLKFAQERLIRELLPVLDDFDRALAHADETNEDLNGIMTGIRLVLKRLHTILQNQGLVKLETVGKKFDPHFHEAVGYAEEEGEEDIVIEEVAAGYMLHDRLLRAAKVRVRVLSASKGQSDEGPGDEQEEIT